MNGVIYTRVSTKEQAEKRTSLDHQQEECQKYAFKHDVVVPENHIFREEGESAKFIDRTELQNLLRFVRENKGKVDTLYIWKIDRLARSLGDYYGIKVALSKYGVKIVSVTEPIDDDPVGRFLEAILAAAAQFDNDIRAVRSVTGMRGSVEKGGWPHQPPVGYIKVDKRVEIDPIKGPIIRNALKMFSTGNYTRKQIAEYLYENDIRRSSGERKTDDQIKSMVQNIIYAGFTMNKLSTSLPAVGRHEALVEEDVIKRNKVIIAGKQTNYVKRGDELYPLRGGTLLCSSCNKPLTGGAPKSKYPSYYCNRRTCTKKLTGKTVMSASIDKVHADFRDLLDQMKPLTEIESLFKRIIVDSWNKANRNALNNSKLLDKEITRYEDLRQKANEDWIEGIIKPEDRELKINHYDSRLQSLKEDRKNNEEYIDKKKEIIEDSMYFISDPKKLWNKADLQVKKAIQELLFPKGITYDFGTGYGTVPKLESSLLLCKINDNFVKKTKLVAVTGIEPVTSGL